MNATQIVGQIKEKALKHFSSPDNPNRNYSSYHIEHVNGHKIVADVIQQRKNTARAIQCRWYLDGKKSSLAEVIAAIS